MTSNDLKRGLVFLLDSAPCLVLDLSSQSPSARGGSTLIKTKFRNLLTGQVLEKTFKAGERVDDVHRLVAVTPEGAAAAGASAGADADSASGSGAATTSGATATGASGSATPGSGAASAVTCAGSASAA